MWIQQPQQKRQQQQQASPVGVAVCRLPSIPAATAEGA